MDISIIIVNYKTPQLLVDCIDSIKQYTNKIDYEVIVVDNNSEDESESIVMSKYPDVKYLYLKSNYGFGYANNRGVDVAEGDYVFFLNSDTRLIENSIFALYNYLKGNPNVGICGGNLVDAQLNPTNSYTHLFPGIRNELSLLSGNLFLRLVHRHTYCYNDTNTPLIVARLSGADMMIPRALFIKVGGFDEAYFLYSEETDLAYRIKMEGYASVCIPNSKIIHLEGKSCSFSINKTRWGLISRDRFLHKKYNNIGVLVCNLLHVLSSFLFFIRSSMKGNKELVKVWNYELKNIFKITQYDKY